MSDKSPCACERHSGEFGSAEFYYRRKNGFKSVTRTRKEICQKPALLLQKLSARRDKMGEPQPKTLREARNSSPLPGSVGVTDP